MIYSSAFFILSGAPGQFLPIFLLPVLLPNLMFLLPNLVFLFWFWSTDREHHNSFFLSFPSIFYFVRKKYNEVKTCKRYFLELFQHFNNGKTLEWNGVYNIYSQTSCSIGNGRSPHFFFLYSPWPSLAIFFCCFLLPVIVLFIQFLKQYPLNRKSQSESQTKSCVRLHNF